jgi:hypothetical protein
MQDSEALSLVAVLQAAFPRWGGNEPTARLFARQLHDYDVTEASRGINALVQHREDTTWPSWAEVARWIRESRPKPLAIQEADPEPLPPAEVERLLRRAMPRMLPLPDSPGQVEARIALARKALRDESTGD